MDKDVQFHVFPSEGTLYQKAIKILGANTGKYVWVESIPPEKRNYADLDTSGVNRGYLKGEREIYYTNIIDPGHPNLPCIIQMKELGLINKFMIDPPKISLFAWMRS